MQGSCFFLLCNFIKKQTKPILTLLTVVFFFLHFRRLGLFCPKAVSVLLQLQTKLKQLSKLILSSNF